MRKDDFMRAMFFILLFVFEQPAYAAPGVDPLSASINRTDADRFAKLFAKTGGKPSAADLQRDYLDGAGPGVAIFTPNRIENAKNLAEAVAKNPETYAYAIKTCLPLVDELAGQMRATYLAYRGLVPDLALPPFYLVFGAGTSGGYATPDGQVIALEVTCGPGTSPDQFRASMRGLFAHETVHSWQGKPQPAALRDLLLLMALFEGTPDFLATLVTGNYPNADRDVWARNQEARVWDEFQRDRATIRNGTKADNSLTPAATAALQRWFYNYGKAPEGWPFEAGYWVGSRIARAYFEKASDKQKALRDLIEAKDPQAILSASGYQGK
jgi:hypothetical protein